MYTWLKIESAEDLKALAEILPSEYDPDAIIERLAEGLGDTVKAILIEDDYVDKDYRSTFYNFYAKKGRTYKATCMRLHFFNDRVEFNADRLTLISPSEKLSADYFGFMVLRPTGIATVGRSVLAPHIRSGAKGLCIVAKHNVSLLGYNLTIDGMPSMDQHIDIAVCAHAACWSILRHLSVRFSTYKEYLTYDITLMASEFNPGGLVPSKGLEVSHAERVFQEAGTFPLLISKLNENDEAFFRQLQAYVASGFPLFAAMHNRTHAIAVTGYSWINTVTPSGGLLFAWDAVEFLTVIDDNHLPYLPIPATPGAPPGDPDLYVAHDIDTFIVPLPEKVFYPADAVDLMAAKLFSQTFFPMPPQDGTIIRYFLTTGSQYRNFIRDQSALDPRLVQVVMEQPFAQFVWVVEYATIDQWNATKVSTVAILDATASKHEQLPLWLLYNNERALVADRSTVGHAIDISIEFDLENTAGSQLERFELLQKIL